VLDWAEVDEAEAHTLYARSKDGTLITEAGITYMDFDRPANSLDEAVPSAIHDAERAGTSSSRSRWIGMLCFRSVPVE
jgi:hypothetical protein